MLARFHPWVRRYGVVLLSLGAALGLRLLLEGWIPDLSPFFLLLAAITASAWHGGFRAGLLTTLLGGLLMAFLFLAPRFALNLPGLAQELRLLSFAVEGLLISVMAGQLHAARQAEEAAAQARQAEMEERQRAEAALREREAEERHFTEQLIALQEVGNRLSRAGSLDELCRQAVELGCSRLGFDRLGIWFASESRDSATGTYGLDESGQLRDERDSRIRVTPGSLAGRVLAAKQPVLLEGDAPVMDHRADVVGRGMHAIAGLWDGEEVIGFVSIDNLLRGEPITERQSKLLTLYASALGHLCAVKRLQGELRERAEALAEADRRKDQFLAMLAHELRNPLAPIRNAAHLLKQWGPAEPRLVRTREIIDRQVRHLARQLDDLLDVSRITRGKVELRPVRLDLAALVRETAEDTRGIIEEAGLTLTLELPEEPLWVEGDPTRLAQVVGNLLANAVKFTHQGGEIGVECPVLDVRSSDQDTSNTGHRAPDTALLTVRDSGVGIEPEMLPHVFETFTQADRSLDRSQGGLGLGLALVKGLVELHGGQVEVQSEGAGRGAAFTVRLPLAAPPAAAAPEPPAMSAAGPIRVLIVEDNRDSAETLRDLLEYAGCTVAVAYSGPEALALAPGFRPEVVLCDLGLPGMNGHEVAAALRRDPAVATARLIAVTGYGQEEDRRRSHDAGFDLHLIKPIDPDELQRLLEVAPEHPRV